MRVLGPLSGSGLTTPVAKHVVKLSLYDGVLMFGLSLTSSAFTIKGRAFGQKMLDCMKHITTGRCSGGAGAGCLRRDGLWNILHAGEDLPSAQPPHGEKLCVKTNHED